MIDFLMIATRTGKRGTIEIYPKFIIKKSKDLMIRGSDFYAVWMEERGLWSTDEQDALQMIDRALDIYAEEHKQVFNDSYRVLHMWDAESGMIDNWHKYCQRQMRDNYHTLDDTLIFANTPVKKESYASKRLPYLLEEGNISAYDELMTSAFPGQSTKGILPINKIKETEAYCPTYENGTRLALIRYPHAGTFEIPIVTVNNKNVSGKRNLGAIQDAIGINAKVAERLSGADFDGDTVMAIPVTDKVNIKSTRALKALEGFDPKTAYAVPEGNPNNVRLMKKEEKQREMGVISNLITDMTLRGADEDELARAVKHSMVVIDAEKHKLDYKRSERENGIPELKQKWQIRVDEEGATHYGGASTLLSRRKQTVRVPERRGSVRVDKETGEYIYKESGRTFTDPKTGKERKAEDTVSLISETKDARTLSSGTIQENLYADFSNKLKAMANQARKEAVNMKGIQRNPEAAKTYAPEVASLKEKYNNMVANKPKERKAMLIANANIKAKIQEQGLDPTIDKKEIKKISSVEMQRARDSVGASGRKSKITFTDREWEAVQAGAISDNMLTKFLNSSDSDEIVKRAMPKNVAVMTSAKMSKANAMLRSGYSYAEIAKACGVPESTVYSALNK